MNWQEFIEEQNHEWIRISKYQNLSESFIREFQGKVRWFWISTYQNLSKDFIREFQNKVNWINISAHQNLSEDILEKFKDKINWKYIDPNNLSQSFLERNLDLFDVHDLIRRGKISKDCFEKEYEYMNLEIYKKLGIYK